MADLDTRDNAAVRNHVPLIPGYKAVAQQLQYVIAQASAWRAYQLPNPSTALAQDADIREVVLRDATVRQADDIHRRATAGRTWAVVPQSEEWDEQWLAQIVERDLRNIKGFTEARYELAGAVLVGDAYAYIEYDEVYRWGSQWCIPRRLVDLDWRTIRYVPRDGIAVRQWSYEVAEDGRLVPSSVFTDVPEDWPLISIVYNDSASRLKRGRGLIDALAPSVWRKANLFQSLLDAVEAHGSGYLIAAIDSLRSGSSDAKSEEVVAWLEVLQRMRASHIVAHDKDDEVRIESPQGGGIDAILSAIRYEDDQIRSLLLGSSLPFGGGSDGGGSLARSQEEKDTHESRIEYDRAKIDDDLSEQLIGWYLRVNRRALREYGLPAEVVPPRFESGVGPRETFAEIVEAAKGMTELGAPISLADLYERSPFSQPVDGEPTTEAKQPQQPSPWGGEFRARTGERFAGEYDESKHDRDADGKFAPKGAGGDGDDETDTDSSDGDDYDPDDWGDMKPAKAKAWHAAGVGDADEAAEWEESGYTPKQAGAWLAAGFDASEAAEWDAFEGVTVKPEAAAAYRDAGFEPDEAADWIGAGVKDADAAAAYAEAGLDAEDSAAWIKAGAPADVAAAWNESSNWDGDEALKLHKAGVSPDAGDAYGAAGWSLKDTAKWAGATADPDEAEAWKAAGVKPDDAAPWIAGGYDVEDSHAYRAAGFTPETAVAYSDAIDHYGAEAAGAAAAAGIAPGGLDDLVQAEYDGDLIDHGTWDGEGISDNETAALAEMGADASTRDALRAAGVSWDAITTLHDEGFDIARLVPSGKFRRFSRMVRRARDRRRRFAAEAEMADVQREVAAALAELIDGLPEDVQEPLIYTALGILDSGETDDATEAIEAALLLIDDGQFAAAKWDESKHPRDGGKFAPKEGAGSEGDTHTAPAADTQAGGDATEGKPKGKRGLRERVGAAMRGLSDKVKAARAAVKAKGLVGASKEAAGQAYGTAKKTAAGIANDLEGAGYSPRMAKGIAGLAAAVIVSPIGFAGLAGGALGMPALAMVPGVVEAGVIVKGAKGAVGVYKRGKKAAGAAVAKVRGKRKGGDPGKAGKQGDSKKEPPA